MWLGIDQSPRSTGVVLVDDDGKLSKMRLICPPEEINEEDLIAYQWEEFCDFIYGMPIKGGLIEGLSFGSTSSSKDLLAGLHWYYRTQVRRMFNWYLGIVAVSQWRCKVLTKEEQKQAKEQGNLGLKKAVVDKLPQEVCESMALYVRYERAKHTSLYDLADAYCIAQYRRNIGVVNGGK